MSGTLVVDVALQTNEGLFRKNWESWNSIPDQKYRLSDDLWVGRLDSDLARKVIESCEPPGMWIHPPTRQYSQLYAFGRDVGDTSELDWDREHRLYTCITLSRVVHPTTVSLAYAARIMSYQANSYYPGQLQIIPGPVRGHSSAAFLARESARDWLTIEQLDELRTLIANLSWKNLPERIQRALWLNDHAACEYFLDVRWGTLCTGLEALIHTDRERSTHQFVSRVATLAERLSLQIAEEEAKSFYELRSGLVHGGGFPELSGEKLHLYEAMETLLRKTISAAILDPGFADLFRSNEAVRNAWSRSKASEPSRRPGVIKAVRGTRDLLPPDTDLWNQVDAKVRDVFARYNYHEIRTPMFEDTALFSRSVGEETDIVSKEMFTWEDKARAQSEKAQSLTLRPENTAGVVRAYIEHGLDKKGALQKLYYIGPQFRRERPQKGRYRQFYQIGAEIIGPPSAGSESPLRDAEVLEMLATLLDEVGLRDWRLQLNSVGCAEDRARYNQALREALQPVLPQMCDDCQRRAETNPLRVLDCKVPEDQPIIEKLPKISQYLDEPCREHFAAGARDAGCHRHSRTPSTSAWCAGWTITRARRSSSPMADWARRARYWAAGATMVFRSRSKDRRHRALASPLAKTG